MQHLKVGGWVENSKSSLRIIKQVTAVAEWCDTVTVGNKKVGINVMLITDLKLWKPKPGEWCWFMNKDRIPTLSQFVEFHEDINKYFATYPNKPNSFGAYYTNCEPFIGELPSDLKGFNK